ncbi:hypothetical protein [Jatrophihabitans fulvus]
MIGRGRPGPAPRGADDPIARYATRFHRVIGGEHAVCSPAGAWLLLALIGPSATGAARDRLSAALGCDLELAHERARVLLAEPPADLVAAAAVWSDPTASGPGLRRLATSLAGVAATGAVPDQATADRWTREHTLGLVERFPLELDDPSAPVLVVLATALATRIRWTQPYLLAPPDILRRTPADPAFARVPMLTDGPRATTWNGIVHGRFGVHAASSPGGLVVASAIGAPGEDPAAVLDVAQQAATERAAGGPVTHASSLFDLPLGDGPAWTIAEHEAPGPREQVRSVVAAWEADSDLDLLEHPDLGFGEAGAALAALLSADAPPLDVEARQVATARYTRLGFEAAAVATLAVRAAGLARSSTVRTAQLEFTHPYAVVAAVGSEGPWRGLPVFSAWVARPAPSDRP